MHGAVALGALLVACASPARPVTALAPLPSAARVWEYRVRATPGARELRVEVALPPGVPEELGLDAFAHPFLRGLELATEQGWQAIAPTGSRWIVPRCEESGCRLRYVYRLGEAALRIDRFAYAGYRAGTLLAPPSTFLLAPQDYAGSDRYRFSVELAPGESFVTGVWRDAVILSANRRGPPAPGSERARAPEAAAAPAQGAAPTVASRAATLSTASAARTLAALGAPAARPDALPRARATPPAEVFSAPAGVLFQAPYSAFGRFDREALDVGGGSIALAIAPGAPERPGEPPVRLGVSREGLRAALRRAAAAVSSYYGRFPLSEVTLIVLPSPGGDIFGMQLGIGGATIVLFLGADVDDGALARDWVLTHELLHLGFPTLGRRHLWLAEGLATYQEPLARRRSGLLSEPEMWSALLDGMPKGLPNATDGGLDGSMRWGRTYWGGAIFCLLLDVEVRARTDNRLSLDSVARAILFGGGDTSMRWSLEQTLAAGDAALDRPSFSELYSEHAAAPVSVDLDGLFARLGVRRDGAHVTFDDGAELSHVRRAIGQVSAESGHEPQSGFVSPGVP